MNKSPTLHSSRSYKRSLGRFVMTGGLVTTLDGSTTSTNKLQTIQTLSTNYTEHIRLPYFVSEHTMHSWTHTFIASRKNTKQSVSTAPIVMRPLNISCSTAHCTSTSDPDYCQLNQIHPTCYMDPLHNCNEQPPTTCQPWTDVTRLSEVWGAKKGKKVKVWNIQRRLQHIQNINFDKQTDEFGQFCPALWSVIFSCSWPSWKVAAILDFRLANITEWIW